MRRKLSKLMAYLLTFCMLMSLMPATAFAIPATHSHAICGAAHTDIGDHTGSCESITWTAWNGEDAKPFAAGIQLETGNYYLTGNLTINNTIRISGTVNLCLNGHTISNGTNSTYNVIEVSAGATLNICDCSEEEAGSIISNSANTFGEAINNFHGTVNVYGGSIRATGNIGNGINNDYGTVNVYGGSISAATGNLYFGIDNDYGTVNVHGGSISATDGCYYGIYNNGSATVSGGTVSGSNNGIHNSLDASLTVSGNADIIGGNYGISNYNGNLQLSGSPNINGETADIRLDSGSNSTPTIEIVGVLTSTEKYTVMTHKTPAADTPVVFTSAVDEGNAAKFESANSDYQVIYEDGVLKLAVKPTHTDHPVCGKTCTHDTTHETITWTAWESTTSLPSAANNYYLTADVTISSRWEPANGTVLCLNGHTITMSGNNDVIKVGSDKTFTLTDCGATGTITHASGAAGRGASVYGGTFNMYCGSITGNSTDNNGGGVLQSTGTVNMYGGSITGNTAEYDGGGVHAEYGTFNMYDGSITCNSAGKDGGGANLENSSVKFNMSGGSITDNSAAEKGGGVYVYSSTFTVSGSPKIIDNTKGDADNNLHLSSGMRVTVGGVLSEEAQIGITIQASGGGTFTSDWSSHMSSVEDTDISKYFTSDSNGFTIQKGTNDLKLVSAVVSVTGVELNKESTTLTVGGTETLTATVVPDNATNKAVTWSSNNESVATVADGVVSAIGEGTATITVTTADGGKTDTCIVTVLAAHEHPICGDAECASHGSGVAYTAWDGTGTPSGNVYLTDNVTLTETLIISSGEVNLCLNGYSIISNGIADAVTVSEGATLNICDCQGDGSISATSDGTEITGIDNSGSVNVYGGTVKAIGSKISTKTTVGIENKGSGSVNVYGGTVETVSSGNVFNMKNNGIRNTGSGTVNICGGTVKATHTDYNGSGCGIENAGGGSVNISDGNIDGKLVGLYNISGTVTVSGGTVKGGNTGISANHDIIISGSPNITGGCDIALYMVGKIIIGGALGTLTDPISVDADSKGIFTSGWTDKMGENADYDSYFTAWDDGYTVQPDGSGELQLVEKPAHVCQWSYSIKADQTDIIVATCNGEGECTSTANKELAIIEPLHIEVNDGKNAAATLSATSIGGISELPDIVYYKYSQYPNIDESSATTTPFENVGGTYKAQITVGGVTAYTNYTVERLERDNIKSFTISDVTVNSFVITLDEADRSKTDFVCQISSDIIEFTPDTNGRATITVPDVYAGSNNLWVYVYQKQTDIYKKSNTKDTTVSLKNPEYTVIFNANGGSGTMANQTITLGEATALSENIFTKTGYTFEGWATTAAGTKVYNDKQSVSDLTNAGESITLFAVWNKIPAYAPTITLPPQGFEDANALTYANIGADKKLSVETNADEKEYTVTYQWYKNTTDSKDGAAAVGTEKDLAIENGLNAGDYYYYCKITVTRKDNGESTSVDTDLVKVTVNKAAVAVPTAASKVYTGSTLKADISETADYTVTTNNGGITVGQYDVVLNLKDSANYKWSDGTETAAKTIKFEIKKATANAITGLAIEDWTYGEIAKTPSASATFGTPAFTYEGTGETNYAESTTPPSNAGTYKVIAKVADTANFVSASYEMEFAIAKATPNVSAPTAKTGLVYNGADKELISAGTTSGGEMQYSLDNSTWTTEIPQGNSARSYTVYYKVVGGTNYNDNAGGTVKVTIAKAQIAKPSADSRTFTYTGNEQTYNVTASDYYTVNGTTRTDAGSQNVTVALKDKNNYEWADGTTDDITFTFNIGKADAEITINGDTSIVKTYGDIWELPTASSTFGTVTKNKTEADLKNAGTYTVTYSVAETENYKQDTKTVSVTVNPLPVNITWENTESLVYDGNEKTINPIVANKVSGDTFNFAFDGTSTLTATEKGTYTATVTDVGNANYTLTGGINLTKTWAIAEAANEWTTPLSITGWIYGGTANEPTAAAKFGTPVYTYANSVDGAYTSDVPTSAGTWYVKATVAGATSYAEISDTKEFVITEKELNADSITAIGDVTFTGEEIKPAVEVRDGNTILVLGTDYEVAYQDNTNAGTAKVIITFKGNYKGTPEKSFIILPKKINPTITLAAPVSNETPVTSIETEEYTATVVWSPTVTDKFAYSTEYTATVTITPKANYTVTGITENEYTIEGATVTNAADSGNITAVFAKTGSRPSSGGVSKYTVKFETNGGTTVANKSVTRNALLAEPTAPTKDGYTFDGWYTDKELATAYDFDTKVTKSFTLYAKWTEIEKEPEDTDVHNCPSKEFTDLDVTAWYHLDTDYAIENGIFKGVTETTFAPDDKLTRAMLVTVLYRVEGEPATNRSIPFADVDMGAYYANAVIWGQQNGIINGYSETEFGPDDKITREQIAAIMHRYAQYKGIDVSVGENTNILSYDDFDSISEYAIPSMQWAVGSGLIKGKSESTLNPLDNATRVEIAAILHRFIEANK